MSLIGKSGSVALIVWFVSAASGAGGGTEPPVFVLKDGGRISGEFEVKELEVETAYGSLTVPLKEVHKVIFGIISDPELAERIEKIIQELGDSSFDVREKAMADLRVLGWSVEKRLRRALKTDDPEIRQRVQGILTELEEEERPPGDGAILPEEDTVVTRKFTIRGRVLIDSFQVKTQFGLLQFEKKDIRVLYIDPPKSRIEEVKVPGISTVNRQMFDTKLRVSRGDQLTMRASGTVLLVNWGGETTPEGSMQWGMFNNRFQTGSLVCRIGKAGALFLVGRHHSRKVERDGIIYLGLAVNDSGQNTGEFKVRIEVTPAP